MKFKNLGRIFKLNLPRIYKHLSRKNKLLKPKNKLWHKYKYIRTNIYQIAILTGTACHTL